MHDRVLTGVLIVTADNVGPMSCEEFDRWYDEVHVPDILESGCYYAATRYEAAGTGEGQYLAIYETDWPDPMRAFEQFAARLGHMRKYDGLVVRHMAPYLAIGGAHRAT